MDERLVVMATMNERMFEAARSGDVEALDSLVNEDPFILDNLCLNSVISKTPLNVASRAGHVDFVKKIVSQKSWLAWMADKDGFTPLHLAAARAHREVARQLLSLDRSSRDEGEETQVEIIDDASLPMEESKSFVRQLSDHISPALGDAESVRIFGSVIVAATYQAVVPPPTFIWRKGMIKDPDCQVPKQVAWPGLGIDKYCAAAAMFYCFIVFNTLGLLAAIALIIFNRRAFTTFLILLALVSLAATYLYLLADMLDRVILFYIVAITIIACLSAYIFAVTFKAVHVRIIWKRLARAARAST